MKKSHVYPEIIYIPYDPDDEVNFRERQNLLKEFEMAGWEYRDAKKMNYYGDDVFVWVMEKQ